MKIIMIDSSSLNGKNLTKGFNNKKVSFNGCILEFSLTINPNINWEHQ